MSERELRRGLRGAGSGQGAAYLLTQVALLRTDLQDAVAGLLGQLLQERVAVVQAVVLQVRVLHGGGGTSRTLHHQSSHCSQSPVVSYQQEPEVQRKRDSMFSTPSSDI